MKGGKQSKTPLQEKLNDLADDIGNIGFKVTMYLESIDGLFDICRHDSKSSGFESLIWWTDTHAITNHLRFT